jgi:hypothetical protein
MKHDFFSSHHISVNIMHLRALDIAIKCLSKGETVNEPAKTRPKMYSLEYRKCVMHLYGIMGSLRAVASVVQPSIATISRWFKDIQPKHSSRENKPKTITEDMLAAMQVYVFENPAHSTSRVRQFLVDMFGIVVCACRAGCVRPQQAGWPGCR